MLKPGVIAQAFLLTPLLSGFMVAHAANPYAPAAQQKAEQRSVGIVKSIDAQGRVVYSDRALLNARQVDVMQGRVFSNSTTATPPSPAVAAPDGLVDWAAKAQAQLDASKKKQEDMRVAAAQQTCQNARQTLASLSTGKRVMRLAANGQQEIMSEDQQVAERAAMTSLISVNCK